MIKILLIEDNPDHRELIEEYCHQAFGTGSSIVSFDTLYSGLNALAAGIFDIALIDLSLPDSNAEETAMSLKELVTSIPVIVLTSLNDEQLGQQLVKNGAQDFLPKDSLNIALLHRMVNYAIERKQGQFNLEQRTIDQQTFCRSLSHDFKAPVRNVKQLALMLKNQLSERGVLVDDDDVLLLKIDERLSTMNQLIDGLYHYILSEEVAPTAEECVDLNEVMLELSPIFSNYRGRKTNITYTALPTIKGNYSQIYLLMQNIIENAIKFSRADPVILVSFYTGTSSDFATHLPNKITIKDNGIGIAKRFIKDVFRPFRRLHSDSEYSGSGLGLSIVQRIMQNHKGEILIESEQDKGTCITLAFP